MRDQSEYQRLDRLLIHHQMKPLFDTEMDKFRGRCGSLSYAGDGEGLFVFAVIPAAVYNAIREAVSNTNIKPEERVLFQAIVLRDVPAAARQADGSLSYSALEAAGFYYLGLRDLPDQSALDVTALPSGGGGSRSFLDVFEAIYSVAVNVVSVVTHALGAVDRLIQGSVTVTLDLDVKDRDARLAGRGPTATMRGGWGQRGELSAWAGEVDIMQWGQHWYTLGAPIPMTFTGTLNDHGIARVKVAKDDDSAGGGVTSRGSSGVCYRLQNPAVFITSLVGPDEVCDFSGAEMGAAAGAGSEAAFEGFTHNVSINLRTRNFELALMTELTDSARFLDEAVGVTPPQARVLQKFNATVLSPSRRPYVPCFGFPNLVPDAAVLTAMGLGTLVAGPLAGVGAAAYTAVLGTTDIDIPGRSNALQNRGLLTHEYGHYALCALMDAVGGGSPALQNTVTTFDMIASGGDPDPNDEARVINEAFADFYAGQVAGGTNYFKPTGTVNFFPSGTKSDTGLCNQSPCVEQNWSEAMNPPLDPVPASGILAIGRLATLLQDAFDGLHAWYDVDATNGDAWQTRAGTFPKDNLLEPATAGYSDTCDEDVALHAPGILDFVSEFYGCTDITRHYDYESFHCGLGKELLANYNWCQACRLFALHEPGVTESSTCGVAGAGPTRLLSGELAWRTCDTSTRISAAIGVPPMVPGGLYFDESVCCPSGQVRLATGCTPCQSNEIVVNNTCTRCPFGQGANRQTNLCEPCPIDATIDWWWAHSNPDCASETFGAMSTPGDVCPESVWVQVTTSGSVDGPLMEAVLAACGSEPTTTELSVVSPSDMSVLWSRTEQVPICGTLYAPSYLEVPGTTPLPPSLLLLAEATRSGSLLPAELDLSTLSKCPPPP